MSNWFLPVSKTRYKFRNDSLLQFKKTGWMLSDACVTISDKGSMDMELIKTFVQHLDRFVRKHLPGSLSYVLLLDGHGSRRGVEWLNICQDKKCEVVQSPENTSHFLQPCDQFIKKVFQETIRSTRDSFCAEAITDTKAVGIRSMCGINGYQNITTQHVRDSWKETGLWPMDYGFSEKLRRRFDTLKERVEN